jgi:phage shock protein B
MTPVLIVAIVFGGFVMGLAIIAGTILMAMRMRQGGLSAKSRKAQAEEARLIQELYQGLQEMEKRVESLETILMDYHRKDRPS